MLTDAFDVITLDAAPPLPNCSVAERPETMFVTVAGEFSRTLPLLVETFNSPVNAAPKARSIDPFDERSCTGPADDSAR
jgi:hypothetical protein